MGYRIQAKGWHLFSGKSTSALLKDATSLSRGNPCFIIYAKPVAVFSTSLHCTALYCTALHSATANATQGCNNMQGPTGRSKAGTAGWNFARTATPPHVPMYLCTLDTLLCHYYTILLSSSFVAYPFRHNRQCPQSAMIVDVSKSR